MRSVTQLTLTQPCPESWAAMTPAATGRHCAACVKTVVDFSHMADAEILEYLARAGRDSICGRVRPAQLARPLQPVLPPPPTRWRTWLAALAAVWGLRESLGTAAPAQAPMEQRAAPALDLRPAQRRDSERLAPTLAVVTGTVVDASTGEAVAGATVLIHGTNIATAANAAGQFSLAIPAGRRADVALTIDIKSVGYEMQSKTLADFAGHQPLRIELPADTRMLGGMGVIVTPLQMPPATRPLHPLYGWLTRPFRS